MADIVDRLDLSALIGRYRGAGSAAYHPAMLLAGGGFEQSYNAQAAVDTDTMLVIATGLTQAANDKQQITPMVETLGALPEELGEVSELLTDAGYYSEANVAACVEAGIDPLIATGRESHHLPWQERSVNRRRSVSRPMR